jgi:3-deoxy-D-manno-octulosonic-acid transferase
VIHAVYSGALGLLLLGYAPLLLARRLRGRGHPAHLRERLGWGGGALPPEPRCWIHAVSVGEALTAAPLVDAIRRRWPELGIVVSTVTATGGRIVQDKLGGRACHRFFPLDLPGPVGRALDGIRPRFFVGLETELWPNFIRALAERGVPAMIANGRISDRSFRRYRLVRGLLRRVLARIAVFGMQSAEDARRIIALGAAPDRVVVTGSLKTDAPVDDGSGRAVWERLLGLAPGERLLVAGSTHRGEEGAVVEAWRALRGEVPDLRLLVAPRHPERVGEVEALLAEAGVAGVRRTSLPRAQAPGSVIVLDTIGELAELYRLADVVFVGGSLVPAGGHNMLEPVLRLRPVLFGPHTENFRDTAAMLLEAGGAERVADATELAAAVRRLLREPDRAAAMARAGFAAVQSRQGAVESTMALIERFLWPAGSPPPAGW